MRDGAGTRTTGRVGWRAALLAGYPLVFGHPTLRLVFVVLLLAGTASGMVMSYVAVWATETFALGPQGVANLFVVSGLAGAVVNPAIGFLSDRLGHRRPVIAALLILSALVYLGYTQARDYSVALLLMAFSGFGIMGLTLAIVHDLLHDMPDTARGDVARIASTERTAWSIGIIIGPAVAAAIVTVSDSTLPVFVVAAAVEVIAAGAILLVTERSRSQVSAHPAVRAVWTPGRRAIVGILVASLILLTMPSQTRTVYLPLFVLQVLGESRGAVGPLFTLTAIVAVLTMPYVGSLADRIGAQRVLYAGAVVGFVYCVLQSLATSYVQTVAIQVLMGLGIALWSLATLIYLQRLLPGRAGVAGGLYLAVNQLTPVVSGVVLGPIAQSAGIPAAFATTAGFVVLAGVLLIGAHRALIGSRTAASS